MDTLLFFSKQGKFMDNNKHLIDEIATLKELRKHDQKSKLDITIKMLSTLNRGEINILKEMEPGLMKFLKNVLNEE